jgi:hypothetical protein
LALAGGPASEPGDNAYTEPVSIVTLANTPDMFMDKSPNMFMDSTPDKKSIAG